jgi:GTPase SAR1 family protein
MTYTFYLEGADNVGKTTLMKSFVDSDYETQLAENGIGDISDYLSYPSKPISSLANSFIYRIKEDRDDIIEDNDIIEAKEYLDSDTIVEEYTDRLIKEFLKDMKSSFIDKSRNSNNIVLADRGPLSTFLYQFMDYYRFKKYLAEKMFPEVEYKDDSIIIQLFKFVTTYLNKVIKESIGSSKPSKLNIVILNNNNPGIELQIDKSETVQYKKDFDNNLELQHSINDNIHDIVNSISISNEFNNAIYNLSNIKFYHINIYDGDRRKTTDEISKELANIIEQRVKEDNK